MSFEQFWAAWPRSTRKGAKSSCKAKWDKLKLDIQADQIVKHVEWMKTTDQWLKNNGEFIPAPLVYLNQQRWDGAEIPEMTLNVNLCFKDPALEKIEADRLKAVAMPKNVAEKIRELKNSLFSAKQV